RHHIVIGDMLRPVPGGRDVLPPEQAIGDALERRQPLRDRAGNDVLDAELGRDRRDARVEDRKSTRLNSSHVENSYSVFYLKKKKRAYARRPTSPCPNSPSTAENVSQSTSGGFSWEPP